MESLEQNENEKKETLTHRGFMGGDPEIKTFESDKKVANFSINTAEKGEPANWISVQVWGDKIKSVEGFKKGDYVEITGNDRTFKDRTNFVVSEIQKAHPERPTVTFKGNVVQDAITKEVGEKNHKVSTFSIGYSEPGSDSGQFVNCQAWHNSVKYNTPVDLLKKGDFVELNGYWGKEYETKNNETKRDLVLTSCKVISHQLSRSATPEQKDQHLIDSVKGGDYKQVEIALKAGANRNILTDEHFAGLSEKQSKAVKDVISKHELREQGKAEKKSNGMKM